QPPLRFAVRRQPGHERQRRRRRAVGAGPEPVRHSTMVLPLYDDNPFRLPHRPIVTWSLIGVNFLTFFAELAAGERMEEIVTHFAVVPGALIGDGVVPDTLPPVVTLFSYMFLHADLWHIVGNMIFLWVFGDNVEEALGRVRFLVFYLGC